MSLSTEGTEKRYHNRLKVALVHSKRYAFDGAAKLARDVGVSRSTVSRIMTGRSSPTLRVAQAITNALGDTLGKPLKPDDLFSPDGAYNEPSGCRLCDCRGCIPEYAFERSGRIKTEYKSMKPGDWTLSPERNHPSTRS